tara:strand:+ start:73747 stop:74199 length:453 start_codon:yes stop_codon:yes gene_type:complete
LEKAWSQEDLAEISGISVRTIQRAENGQKLGLESLKALAAVFETDVSTLIQEQHRMTQSPSTTALEDKERRVIAEIRRLKGFYRHILVFVIVISVLAVNDFMRSPDDIWIHYVALAWGAGLVFHGTLVFGKVALFGSDWEQREFEKRMQR